MTDQLDPRQLGRKNQLPKPASLVLRQALAPALRATREAAALARANRLLVIYQVLNMPILRLLRPKQHAAMVASQFSIPPEYHEQLLDDLQHFSVDAFNQVMHSYMQINLPAKTASPTLVAVGEKETGFAKRSAPALCRGIPGAKGVVAPGLGHLWNLQNPGLFSAMLRAWLAGQPLPDGLLPLEP